MCRAPARATGFFFLVLGLRVGVNFLVLNASAEDAAAVGGSLLVTLAVGYTGYCLVAVVDHWLARSFGWLEST